MPNGTFHANTNLLVAAGATVASLSLSLAENNYSGFIGTIFFVLGVLSGIPLTPDLDLDENYWNSFYFLDIAHKFPGWIWHFFWYPYAKLMRHRSTLSHFPIFSTAIRCAYVLIPLTIAILLFDKEMIVISFFGQVHPMNYIFFLSGLAISDLLHYLADIIL